MLGLLRRLIVTTMKVGVLAGGVGGIIGYANLSDVQGWTEDLKSQVFQISGRRLHVDGAVDFTLTMPPRIVVEGVRLQNASWGSRPDMLKAKSLVAEVDMLPLMLGDVAVPKIRLIEPDILVEVGKSGRSNWDELARFEPAAGGAVGGPSRGINLPTILSSGNLSISGGTVTLSNAGTGVTSSFNIPNSTLDLGSGLPCL